MVFQKALRITKSMEFQQMDERVKRLSEEDVEKAAAGIASFREIFVKCPLEVIIFTYMIYNEMGLCGLVGVGILILLVPVKGEK